jgi:hypothetical protein
MTSFGASMQRHEMIAAMGGLGLKGMAGAFDMERVERSRANVRKRPIADIQATAGLRHHSRTTATVMEFLNQTIYPTFHALVPFFVKFSTVDLIGLRQNPRSTLVRCL